MLLISMALIIYYKILHFFGRLSVLLDSREKEIAQNKSEANIQFLGLLKSLKEASE